MPNHRRSPKMTRLSLLGSLPLALLAGACAYAAPPQTGAALPWPKVQSRVKADPKVEAETVAGLVRGDVVMIDGAGHYPQAEMPDVTAEAILGFLREPAA